ncbi:MAG: DNA-directed RNA polymerase subunit RpoH/Rpb5 C-terminal domain-containing protein [archaeon]
MSATKTPKPEKRPSRKAVKVVKKSAEPAKPKTSRKQKKRAIPFIKNHVLALEHSKASEKEVKEILDKYEITTKELPKISKYDPAIRDLNLEEGMVVKIKRNSLTAGKIIFYREVVNV